MSSRLQGLYVLTDADLIPATALVQQVEQAILGGARVVQYRDKHSDPGTRLQQASALQKLCRQYDACFIVNDDIALAKTAGADGVHLGKEDHSAEHARAQLGHNAIIGISCYNDIARAQAAVDSGADYIAFGSFFASNIKPNAVRADLTLLQQAHQRLDIPIAAIGGINLDNAPTLIDAGADMLAVISAVFGQTDVQAAAQGFSQLFKPAQAT